MRINPFATQAQQCIAAFGRYAYDLSKTAGLGLGQGLDNPRYNRNIAG